MISYLDDFSGFITGSVKIRGPTLETALLLLDGAVMHHGAPRQILTDQGTQFKPARGGTSALGFTAQSWVLNILLQVSVDLKIVARLRLSIKYVSWSLIYSLHTGVLYATTTIHDLTKQ